MSQPARTKEEITADVMRLSTKRRRNEILNKLFDDLYEALKETGPRDVLGVLHDTMHLFRANCINSLGHMTTSHIAADHPHAEMIGNLAGRKQIIADMLAAQNAVPVLRDLCNKADDSAEAVAMWFYEAPLTNK